MLLSEGCTAVPQDSEHNWYITYPASSLSVLTYNAPIFYDIVSKVSRGVTGEQPISGVPGGTNLGQHHGHLDGPGNKASRIS